MPADVITSASDHPPKEVTWGVVGCGSVTELKSTPAYQKVDGFNVSMVMGRDVDRVKDYSTRHHIPNFTLDIHELVESVDAVYVATPPDSHCKYALHALSKSKPCCVEKPIAHRYTDAKQLVDAFEDQKVPLFVAYYRRSLPRFLKVKRWLDAGLIGDVRHLSWNFAKPANNLDIDRKPNWRTEAIIAKGGYFEDLASHGLDLFSFLLGDIQEASGQAVNQQGLYTAKDSLSGAWLHPGGVTASGFWNFAAFERIDEVEIIGSRGKISFSVFLERPVNLKNKIGEVEVFIENPANIQYYHALNIRGALLDEKDHPSTGRTALNASWAMDKILGQL
ncbi:MAG: Gfo/Idh/MocA family oxidoreductase [Pseudomonadales bacterium]|nr:Gfo/Idh/MocA family oxidoreductase [Pseudomonadales bacterium]